MDKRKGPRRHSCTTRLDYWVQLALCLATTIGFLIALGFVTYAFGQEHPFPFKTMDDLKAGTAAWSQDGPGVVHRCPGSQAFVLKKEFQSGAGAIWLVFTDGVLFSAAYFPPGTATPVTVAMGHLTPVDELVVTDTNEPFHPEKHRPCDPWDRKAT